jgi:hypothetical protein
MGTRVMPGRPQIDEGIEKKGATYPAVGIETDALTALNAALGGVEALSQAVVHIQNAANQIDQAKMDIDAKHIAAVEDIGRVTGNAKVELFLWVDNAKKELTSHAGTAVVQAVRNNIQTIANAVVDEMNRRGYG